MGGRYTRWWAPMAFNTEAFARISRSVCSHASGRCRMPNWVPATTRMPRLVHSACSTSGSVGRKPKGPVSITSYPASATSSRKVCQLTCLSSSGNQTPHESGAIPTVSLL